jgi:hypothetical protein
MMCPPEMATILLEILKRGILHARSAGWSGDAAAAAVAADHIHNLPDLLMSYTPHGLLYYWNAERPSFLAHCRPEWAHSLQPHWDRLQAHVERLNAPVAAG